MRLLVVDKEKASFQSVRDLLEEGFPEMEECSAVQDFDEAKEKLLGEGIDIVLTEVEIAGKSGFDLASWMRGEKLDVACIFMSGRQEFSDAQKAISLGARGFLVKPLKRDELAGALSETIRERKKNQAVQAKLHAYEAGERRLLRDFWKDLFYDNIPSERDAIKQYIRNSGLMISPDWNFGIVLLMVRTWQADNYDRLDRFVLNNVARELFEETVSDEMDWQDVMPFGERAQIAICGAQNPESIFELCRKFALDYTERIQQYAEVRLIAYVGEPVPVEGVAGEIEKLLFMDSQHLEDHGVVLYTEADNLVRLDLDTDDRFGRYAQLLCGGRFAKVHQELFSYLDELDVGGGLNKRQFLYFHTRYQEILMKYAQENEFMLSRLVEKPEHAKCFENALRNIQSMKQWIDCSLNQLEELANNLDVIRDPVEATIQYIREHLADSLEMFEIADNVHFNQDYLTRIFKRRMDVSIKSYIVACRMESARGILESSDLPIAEVAYRVGYYNYTSFNRAFKKQFGESPQAFRQRSGIPVGTAV